MAKELELDEAQAASAAQFGRQSTKYGKSHILADTSDVDAGLEGIVPPVNATALDVATGGGHTALCIARLGWKVTATDIAPMMLENAKKLFAEARFPLETQLCAAEQLPFPARSFDLVSVRVAPHHFSSPEKFVLEVARVLKPGGYFLLIDGSVPDNDPETEEWLHQVERWRDPSHGKFLSRTSWEALVREAGLEIQRSVLQPMKQPNLDWYFETAATSPENRKKVLAAVETAPETVRRALQLGEENGHIIWWWPRLTLLARIST